MSAFTLCIPYYENPSMLARQIAGWNAYDPHTAAQINVVLIDDGSPRSPALDVLKLIPCRLKIGLWRIVENIPWNQHGARNLAAKVAGPDDRWLLMTDMDHLLEPEAARELVAMNLRPGRHYTFARVSLPDLAPYKMHCNSFIVQRGDYWKAGGYDEDFCGSYGGDGPFLRALAKVAPAEHLDAVRIVRVPREVIADASTTEWERTGPMKLAYQRKAAEKRGAPPKNPLRFNWERLM